jgi:hypothetical protein
MRLHAYISRDSLLRPHGQSRALAGSSPTSAMMASDDPKRNNVGTLDIHKFAYIQREAQRSLTGRPPYNSVLRAFDANRV